MIRLSLLFTIAIFLLKINLLFAQDTITIPINRILYTAEKKMSSMIENNNFSTYPRSLNSDGSIRFVGSNDWTSGFFPGSLWYMYDNTNKLKYEIAAKNWTADIESQRFNTGTHDLGFMFYCSFGNGLRLSASENYSSILLDAANSLKTRYNSNVGCIRSWDFGLWEFPVIIDNMMNLELLFWATSYTGDSSYFNIAVSHAKTTIKNHFRTVNSSYHVVDYNKTTGEVISKTTHQGYSDESDWTRGQAWGLYGFTMCFRKTNDTVFLHQAEKIANFYIEHNNMPTDNIPYWDLLDPEIQTNPNNVPRDVSAAAISSSALFELSQYSEKGESYFTFAKTTLNNLSSIDYLTPLESPNNFLLLKSTGNKPGNSEINTSINYADYYFMESLTRYRKISNKNFEPFIIYKDTVTTYTEIIRLDTIITYDIDSTISSAILKDNPSFIQLAETNDNKYVILANPQKSDTGKYNFDFIVTNKNEINTALELTYNILDTTTISIIENEENVNIYAFNDQLFVSCTNTKQISIFDINANIVLQKNINSLSSYKSISIANLKQGLFIYIITTDSKIFTGKIIR